MRININNEPFQLPNLKWDEHINVYLDKLMLMYNAIVRPYIDCANSVYYLTQEFHSIRLQRFQSSAPKTCI